MNPHDETRTSTPPAAEPTRTQPPPADKDASDAAWDAGLAAAFGVAETRSYTPPADPEPGTVIAGRYQLSQRIGEGGMGSVWVAHQSEPVKRKVAVKLIKAGMDSKSVLARFEAERQALAVMDHPNIAKVLDGGLHDGRPFFVMELVKGVPITEFCDARKLTPKERLELFVPVCQAIQHAHQKGIIHRDIKPSNVLIALYDDKPVPKVIDFGVAKATGGTLTEQTIETAFGGVVGTPQYMSPEQASLNNLDIDTRSDVYALGVLLYELLTGSPPFSGAELKKRGLLEILRVVREEEPPRPSTKLSTANALPTLSANRGTDPKKLTGLLRQELDWIVMKALEKDRTRRYETANGFAADVNRYLSGEAVQAHPPSTAYRLRKFVRRNKGQVVAAGLVLFTLLAGVAGTTWGLIQAQAAAQAEKMANEQAQKRLTQIEKGNEILGSIFADLDIHEVSQVHRPLEVVLADRLVKAAEQLEGEAVGDPLIVAGLRDRLGRSLVSLGRAEQAIPLCQKAQETRLARLGPDHPDTLQSLHTLAEAYWHVEKLDLAVPLAEEALTRRKVQLGPDHPETLKSMNLLAESYRLAGQNDRAVPLYEDTLRLREAKLGPDHIDTLQSMNDLGVGYWVAGRLALAIPLFEKVFPLREAKLGPNHYGTIQSMQNLGVNYRDAGQFDKAIPLLEEALTRSKVNRGPDHPQTLIVMSNLAMTYRDAGKHDLAIPLLEEAVALRKAKHGLEHPVTLDNMIRLTVTYLAARRFSAAERCAQECLTIREKNSPDDWRTFNTRSALGEALLGQKKYAEAAPLLLASYEGMKHREKSIPPIGRARLPEAADRLVELYTALGKNDEAARWRAERAKYPTVAPMPREKK